MKKKRILILAFACTLILTACSVPKSGETPSPSETAAFTPSQTSKEDPCHKITADEAKKMMEEGGVTVVDVRTAEEYEQKHIPGAILVPNESMKEGQPEALPDLDAVLLIHCRTGVRSKQASDKLASLGYRHIYDFGGIVDWPYGTESGAAN